MPIEFHYQIHPRGKDEVKRIAVFIGDLIRGVKVYYLRRIFDGIEQI